jgi:hypothetical protein
MSKHTPGPWEANGYHIRQRITGTRSIAEVAYTGPHHTPPNEYPKSCRLVDEANARLIAAAPDLLEALEKCAAVIGAPQEGHWATDDEVNDAYDSAVAAIAKAKGEL